MKHCVVSASFTAEPIERTLDYIFDRLDLSLKVQFSPYNQIFQQLLNPNSESSQNSDGVNVFLVRIDDFVRDVDGDEQRRDKLRDFESELGNAFEQFLSVSTSANIILFLPASPSIKLELRREAQQSQERLSTILSSLSGAVVLSELDIEDADFNNELFYDNNSERLGHVPYSELGFSKLALIAARKIHALRNTPKKVLVLDCDNTIWKGVVGEDGVNGIQLTPEFLAIQQFAVDMHDQGVLICLASKNVEEDVIEVFEKRSDMILQLDHIVTHRVNWEHKPTNLQSIANELNLGIDSFVFLDDNPVECAQMQEVNPTVTTLQITSEKDIKTIIAQLWMFDKFKVTEEDAKRTKMYRENSERQKVESSATDISQFLASLNLSIICTEPNEDEWPRVSQLTQRTNQFNFTTIRRSEDEVRSFANQEDHHVLKVDVSDKFGDYGLVGDLFLRKNSDAMEVDTFLLSCRVLGRGVEYEMLREIARLAIAQDCENVKLPYSTTQKNEPALAFADSVIGQYKQGDDSSGFYIVPSNELNEIVYVPGSEPDAVKKAKEGKSKKKENTSEKLSIQSTSERYKSLVELNTAEKLLEKTLLHNKVQRTLNTEIVPPKAPEEKRMLKIWQIVFAINELGMNDHYEELGGTSLMAARLFAEIDREFGVQLRLTTIMDYSTPKKLLEFMLSEERDIGGGLKPLRKGNKESLFLIHDGDGETLLYQNLANHLPEGVGVYGIEPNSLPNIPMAYESIDSMAEHYHQIILGEKPEGAVYLGGMCAGGLIAHSVATKLVSSGVKVENVFMMDSATHDAAKQFGRITKERAGRMSLLLEKAQELGFFAKYLMIAKEIVKKVINTLKWEATSRYALLSRKFRFKLLGKILKSKATWPSYLKPLTVREIYNSAEENCTLPVSDIKTILVKASSGEGGDIPFREVYQDEDLGWSKYVKYLSIVDTKGGHASMLQEPNAENLADILKSNMKIESDSAQ